MTSLQAILLLAVAGLAGGVMNALAGGGTFATLPALLAAGLPANIANATSNLSLMPGAATSAWAFRHELQPIGGVDVRRLAVITFVSGLVGSILLVVTPSRAFDHIVPWLLLYAFVMLAFGPRASLWLRHRVAIGARSLLVVQAVLGIYGGYFGGGIGIMMTATYGLLAGTTPRAMFAPRTLMLFIANLAAGIVLVTAGLVRWWACLPMLSGAIAGGWFGARLGRTLPDRVVRLGTLVITAATTAIFFWRVHG